jgi:hypothetical protein
MPSVIYNSILEDTLGGNVDFTKDAFKVMLVTSNYVPNKEAHSRRSNISYEVSGIGYKPGGLLVPVSVKKNNNLEVLFGLVAWSLSTITGAGAVYYRSHDSLAMLDELVAFVDFGRDVVSINGQFLLNTSTLRFQNGS